MHRGRVLLASLAIYFLTACGAKPVPETPVGVTSTAPQESAATTIPPTQTPAPFKAELVICTDVEPAALIGVPDVSADAIRQLALPSAASYGDDYTAEPVLLVSLPSTDDGTLRRNDDGTLSVTLKYREGLVWSDGTPFTADDAVLGLQAPARASDPLFEVIEVQKLDDLTLQVIASGDTEYPYVPSQPPLPSHVLNEDNAAQISGLDYAKTVNPALGPYLIAEWIPGDHILFQANPQFAPVPVIPVVRLRFIADAAQIAAELHNENGCDVAMGDSLSLETYSAVTASAVLVKPYLTAGSVYEQVIFNTAPEVGTSVPYFADQRVRQAVAQTIDRAAIAQQASQGLMPAMDSWLPVGHWAYTPSASQHSLDVASASALLDEAGWVDQDGDGVREYHGAGGTYTCQRGDWSIEEGTPFTPTLLTTNDDLREPIALKIRTDLEQIGIRVQVQALSPDQLFAPDGPITHRLFDLALFSAVTRPDPGGISRWVGADVFRHPLDQSLVHRWQLEDRWTRTEQLVERLAFSNIPSEVTGWQGQNFAGWCNEQADFDIVAGRLALSISERQPFYAAQQAAVSADVPVLQLFSRPRIAASAPYVCGIVPGPYDVLTWNIATWRFAPDGNCG